MKCKTCKGRGTFIVKETYSDGDEVLTTYTCNDCDGTGISQLGEDGEDYDIGGSNNADDD